MGNQRSKSLDSSKHYSIVKDEAKDEAKDGDESKERVPFVEPPVHSAADQILIYAAQVLIYFAVKAT
jgi:hypothetical protein